MLTEAVDLNEATCEAGVVKNVVLLSGVSKNGRQYTSDCMQRAISKYQGVPVYLDHVAPRTRRSVQERFGVIRNPRFVENKIKGDMHYLTSHPMAERAIEDLKEGKGCFGLSHSVSKWKSTTDKGIMMITEIEEVKSVDLVSEPATTTSLVEQVEQVEETEVVEEAQEVLQEDKLASLEAMVVALQEQVKALTAAKPAKASKFIKPTTVAPETLQEGSSGIPSDPKELAKWLRS